MQPGSAGSESNNNSSRQMAWTETVLSAHQFQAALQDESLWDGGTTAAQALDAASDFLGLAKQSCPTVVLLMEGYHKLQSAALDRQLPPELRTANQVGLKGLPPPAQLYWHPSPNLLHTLQLLSRELTGCAAACAPRQPLKGPVEQLEQVPFDAVERCKLLEVQYILKELRPLAPAQDAPAQQQLPEPQQQPPLAQLQQLPEHQQVWGAANAGAPAQTQPLCQRLSFRVALQRLPAAPAPDEQLDEQEGFGDSSWQQRGLQGCGQTQQVAYTCQLEYPAFTLLSSDYIIPVQLFDKGLSTWQALQKGEAFSMSWDGAAWRGFAQGYRQRRPGDQFLGSPWWSIAVEWEGHSTDRKKDPEDWCYGNPWEMTRERTTGQPKLPDLQTALATAHKAGHPVLAAPWTTVGMAAAAAAAARAHTKRKRHHHHDDDFVYDDGADEEAAGQQQNADTWDPADFYYDDDPEDFELEPDTHAQPRRKSARRQQQHSSSGRRRNSSRRGSPGASADGACCSGRGHKAAAAPGELTHNYGRELLARTDICVVCGSKEGSLISGHAGRGGNCERQYHRGCMLLLNAVGIRSVTLNSKAAQPQQRKRTAAGRDSPSPPPLPPAELAEQMCDGLLGLLWQQCQQAGHGLGAPVVAAVAAAREAAYRVAVGELVLICPSHGCHGCRLNGKLEFMVWCCCCWVRTYHHRQCVPIGAEHVQLDGRDFIRCPHCKAAGVPVPGSAPTPAAVAAPAPVAGGGGVGEPAAAVPPQQGTEGAEAAAGAAAGSQMGLAAAAQSDRRSPEVAPTDTLLQQQLQSPSSDTLQEPSESAAGASAADAADEPAAAYLGELQQLEVVELLDSSESGEGPECITIDSSDDAEQQQQHPGPQQEVTAELQQQRQVQAHAQAGSSGADEEAGSADADLDMLAAVADLDARLQALQQQEQQQQQQLGRAPSGAEGAAEESGHGAAAAQTGGGESGPCIPPWLQLSFEDLERVHPSYVLVPCAAADGAGSSRGSSGAGETASVLAAAAAAAGTLPRASGAAAASAAAGFAGAAAGEERPGLSDPAADAANGLPLASPHSHWLIGCLAKAEAQYKPANVWGCAMIGVPQYPDDSVYGLAVVLDYLPALQQQQQQQPGTAAAASAAAARVRPAVYLRCSKNVAQSGKLQPAMRAHEDGEKRAREWQVLVDGRPYPARQGKNGLRLHVGDVITVQGLHFKLQLLH